MVEGWPERIQEAETFLTVSIADVGHPRIGHGGEPDDWEADREALSPRRGREAPNRTCLRATCGGICASARPP